MHLACRLHFVPGMNKGIYPVLSGGIAQERRLEILTNNLANLHTAGYKRDSPAFVVELPPDELRDPLAVTSLLPGGDQVFVGMEGSFTDFTTGTIHQSGNTLDFAVEGEGFFVVETPSGPGYTRSGNFSLNAERQLTTQEGYPVIGDNGTVQLTGEGPIEVDGEGRVSVNGTEVNRLRVVDFEKPYALKKAANNIFEGEGEIPATNYRVLQGSLEMSNVGGLKEMTAMIEVLRAYESYQKAMRSLDELTEKANEVGRVG